MSATMRAIARPTRPRQTIQVHIADERYAVATCGNMVVIIWRGQTLVAAVARARSVLVETLAHGSGKFGLMQVVEQGAPPPDSAARDALADLLAAGRGRLACSSLVYPGTGFWAAAARAFVTGLTMLARPGFPHVAFATAAEAADWHVQHLADQPGTPSRADICDTVARVEAAISRSE